MPLQRTPTAATPLQQFQQVQREGVVGAVSSIATSKSVRELLETMVALYLAARLAPAGRDVYKLDRALNVNWRAVYVLAELVADGHIDRGRPGAFFEPCVPRIQGAKRTFDRAWMDKIA
jgi:hypothetical protein